MEVMRGSQGPHDCGCDNDFLHDIMTHCIKPRMAMDIAKDKENQTFTLQYDSGKKDLAFVSGSRFNLLRILHETLQSADEPGKLSFSYHAGNGDFFKILSSILNSIQSLQEGKKIFRALKETYE